MNEDQLTKILDKQLAYFFGQVTQHVDMRVNELNERFNGVDGRFDRIESALDGIAGRLDTIEDKQTALKHSDDRQNGWIGQLADSAGVKLVPEQ